MLFPGLDMMRRAFLYQMQVLQACFEATSGNNVQRKKDKGGTFPREITHQLPQQFLASQISERGKG